MNCNLKMNLIFRIDVHKVLFQKSEYKESKKNKRETGFEPATLALARRCSTTEPLTQKAGEENRTLVFRLEV